MEVILLEKIRNLGTLGDKVNVKPGYARNYLMPKGFALPANNKNLAAFESRRKQLEADSAGRLASAKERATSLEGLVVTIKARSAEGKLYGSLNIRELAEAITSAGVAVSKGEISMPNGPIRHLGEYDFAIELHTDVQAMVKILVVEDK